VKFDCWLYWLSGRVVFCPKSCVCGRACWGVLCVSVCVCVYGVFLY
jgi:hypothetical protein